MQEEKVMKIFISYRRDDSAGYAGRLYDYLDAHFGPRKVFMDIDTIEPGDDFRKVVQNAVGTCDVVVVMIGRQWLTVADSQGARRLDDPQDWVRIEVAGALANPNVRVIPVLVHDASMPREKDLPEDLRELSYRNALELSDSRFQHDAKRLAEAIEQAIRKPASAPSDAGQGRYKYLGFAAGAVLLVGLALILLTMNSDRLRAVFFPAPTSTHTELATAALPADTHTPVPHPGLLRSSKDWNDGPAPLELRRQWQRLYGNVQLLRRRPGRQQERPIPGDVQLHKMRPS
jgi:hypothetical protein